MVGDCNIVDYSNNMICNSGDIFKENMTIFIYPTCSPYMSQAGDPQI